MQFHENMLRIRLERGLTQVEAARNMGKCQPEWARWETGARKPGCATMIERIAKALGVDVGELFK